MNDANANMDFATTEFKALDHVPVHLMPSREEALGKEKAATSATTKRHGKVSSVDLIACHVPTN